MTIVEILNYLNTSIKTGFSDAVKSVKEGTFKVAFPKVQKVDVKFPDTQKVSVVNQISFKEVIAKLVELKTSLNDKGVEVKNFPKFPEKIAITNFPEEKELDLKSLENKLDSLNESIKKLPTKFPEFPKIPEVNIPEFPKIPEIVIPEYPKFPKSFNIDNLENLISDDPKKSIPVRLTDGKEFYKAIEEFYQQVSSNVTFVNSLNQKTSALVDDDRHVQVDVLTMPETETTEKPPTDETKFNASTLISYNASDEAVYIDETFDGITYRTTFTRSDMVITSTLPISAVTIL